MAIIHFSPRSSTSLFHDCTHLYPKPLFSPKNLHHFFASNQRRCDSSLQFPSSSFNRSLELPISNKWRIGVSFLPPFSSRSSEIESLTQQLLDAIAPLDRGAAATPEDQLLVEQIASKLEAKNKVKEPLKSTLLNGKWELLYTTSTSILQTQWQRPRIFRPNGKIYQAINLDTLRAQNIETWPFFNQATANLVPINQRRVALKFDNFKIAGVVGESQLRGTAFRLGAVLRDVLDQFLPDDAHIRSNGRVRVAVTKILWRPRGLLVDQFDSKEDLINAVFTSSFIPGYLAPRPATMFRNCLCIDGGLTLFMPPTSAAQTVHVCAFPTGRLGLKGIGISPDCNPENRALEPAADDVLDRLFKLGYLDAAVWAKENPVDETVREENA